MDTEKQEHDMTNIINISTFEYTGSSARGDEGTVEVTLRHDTRRVPASRSLSNPEQITAYGMTGRYQTGSKAWNATVTSRRDPTTGKLWDSIRFGRDDRASKFQKASALSFT
jgi:hypothetical protein